MSRLCETHIWGHFIYRQNSDLSLKWIKRRRGNLENLAETGPAPLWECQGNHLHRPITITSQSLVQPEQIWQMSHILYKAFALSRRSGANFDKLPRVVSLESAPAGPENHWVKNWKGLEAWSREEVGLLSHMAWVSRRDRMVFTGATSCRICMLGPNKQGSISKPEHKIWLFQKTTSYCDSKMKIWKVQTYQCMFDINKKRMFNYPGGIQPTECVSFRHTLSFTVKFKFTWLLPLTAFKGQSFTETNDDVRKKKKNPLPQPHLYSSYGLATVYNFTSWGCPRFILSSYWTLYFPFLSHLPTVHLIDYSMELVICRVVLT